MTRSLDRLVAALAACLLASTVSFGDDEPPARRVPEWGDVVDPSRDCKVEHDPVTDRLTIAVPGTPHLLSAEIAGLPLTAPRVVQAVSADFKATVRVAGKLEPKASKSTDYDPYHGAGLIIWKGEGNYLRLERAVAIIHGRTTPYLNYELRKDGRLAHSQGIPIKDHPLHLKIERVGGEVRAWYGPDGSRWSELPSLAVPMTGRVMVGVVAINSSRYPLRAELERLRIDTATGADTASKSPTAKTAKPANTAGDRVEAK
jgi:regulation of enolase protein 1 (concanavalin A-like superfamily)